MCGIAGFCINDADHKKLKTRSIAKSLLLAIQERGEDATGAAWSENDNGKPALFYAKSDMPAHEFIESLDDLMPRYTRTAILHTRWATKGDPADNDNNHPIVVGNTVGIHNGVITNDNSVSFQFSQNIHANRPMMATASLKITTSTLVAACVTCITSKVSLEIRLPEASRSYCGVGSSSRRANISRRKSITSRLPTQAMQ